MDLLITLLVLALVISGAPLFVIFGALSVWLFAALPDTPVSGAANDMFSEKFADSPLLVTIPLFTFAGVVLASSGAPKRLVKMSRAMLGWMPGGLAIVCLVGSAIFTTFTGGSGVTIVAIGALLFPALLQERYDKRFALGLVTTGGSLGVLFPPSVPVIIYGVVASIDIEGLFIANLVPGLLTVLALMAYSSIIGVRHNLERTPFDAKQAASALWEGKWEAILPIVLVIGLATGMLRIHEAAAFTALYVLVVEVFVYRDIDLKDIPRIGVDCVVLVGAILIILATAIGFTAYLIQANVPQTMLDYMEAFIGSRWAFLLALNVFLVLVGMTMDIFSAIVVVVPLIVPIANHFGINPYHLGAIFLLNLEIGYLTPPLGLNLFISGFRFDRSLPEVYRSVVPFILILGGALALVTYVPGLSTWSSKLHDEAIDLSAPSEPEPAGAPEGSGGSGGETLEDLMKGEDEPIDLGGPAKEGETLDDLMHQGKEGETLEDLTGQGKEGETLDDLMHQGKEGETLEDLMGKAGAPSAP
jgi:tripartite ATP-independent transporter DctM subunit